MAKIGICSTIIGKVSITAKGESETIRFEDKGGIGYAEVTHEQAEQFLKIPKNYWKPGQRNIVDAVKNALDADPEAKKAADNLLNGKKEEDAPFRNVAQTVELIKLCETAEEIDTLVAGDERSGVVTAAAKRKAQIEKGE